MIGAFYKSNTIDLTPTKIRENMYFFGSPNSPDQVRWKGVTSETFGLKLNVSSVTEENLSNEEYIARNYYSGIRHLIPPIQLPQRKCRTNAEKEASDQKILSYIAEANILSYII